MLFTCIITNFTLLKLLLELCVMSIKKAGSQDVYKKPIATRT